MRTTMTRAALAGILTAVLAAAPASAQTVKIGFVGKYVEFGDSYKSLNEALIHGGIANNVKVRLVYIDSEGLEEEGYHGELANVDGILVGPGFGARGVEGKLRAIRYAREKKIPYFGICLGMQCATIEFARNVCGMVGANSTEFDDEAPYKVIFKLRDLIGVLLHQVDARARALDLAADRGRHEVGAAADSSWPLSSAQPSGCKSVIEFAPESSRRKRPGSCIS